MKEQHAMRDDHIRSARAAFAAALAFLAPSAVLAWTEPPATLAPVPFFCAMPRAVDGDTLACSDGTRVRLRGVDTPERGEPGWRAARGGGLGPVTAKMCDLATCAAGLHRVGGLREPEATAV
jgi:endonuclease YncB( thermonuclease family)